MRISNRTLVYVVFIGLIVLFGCGAPAATSPAASYPTSEAQPAATEPFFPEPTESSAPEATSSAAPVFTAQPAMPERRRLTLEFPPEIRAGDSDVVRLTLEVDDLGNITPTAEVGGNVVTGQTIEIPNLYETHRVIAEARFDIAGMEVSPADLVSQPLTQGTWATFFWSVRPQGVGDYRGTIWLSLRFVDKSSGEESQKTVSAQIVDIQAVNFLGLSGAFARTTGVVGSVVGTILGLPFLEDIVKFLFKRRVGRVK
jgi:hypothetical protein